MLSNLRLLSHIINILPLFGLLKPAATARIGRGKKNRFVFSCVFWGCTFSFPLSVFRFPFSANSPLIAFTGLYKFDSTKKSAIALFFCSHFYSYYFVFHPNFHPKIGATTDFERLK